MTSSTTHIRASILTIITLIGAAVFLAGDLSAQPERGGRGGGRGMPGKGVGGSIIDAATGEPVEFATIIVFKQSDSSKVGGASSNAKGRFFVRDLPDGEYYLTISFVGYKTKLMDDIAINSDKSFVRMRGIELTPIAVSVEGIGVHGGRAPIEYKIDKKVINVNEQLTASSGSAVDVLENAPSVSVDIEGNVQLRGSSNFTVLIDGRPSILDANDALEQIPASTIDNIEIITNPSAKYDPDGTSGIINVILKRGKLIGVSGVINSSGGSNDRYGTSVLLNYRNGRYNSFVSLDLSRRNSPGDRYSENSSAFNGVTSYLNSIGSSERSRKGYGGRAGIDISLTERDNLGFSMRYGKRDMERGSRLDFVRWSSLDPTPVEYSSENLSDRSGDFYAVTSDYRHAYDQRGHELTSQLIYSTREMDELQINRLFDAGGSLSSGTDQYEAGPSTQFRFKVDYTRPLSGDGRFEAGYQSRMGRAEDDTRQDEFNPASGLFEQQPAFTRLTEYQRNIHSLYSMYSNEIDKFGYQAGLRGEYTYRNISSPQESSDFTLDRWDFFPTFHASYSFKEGQQMMASYSRRTRRSRGWYMEPFLTWTDPYNVRLGNPELKPQFVNSFELGFQQFAGHNMLSVEAYYRITDNRIEFIRSVYAENVTLHSVENVGKDYALGTEFMINFNQLPFVDMNAMINLFNYRVEGDLNGVDYSSEDFSWSARLNSVFKLAEATQVQVNNSYRSGSVTSQGERDGVFITNVALRQDFFGRLLSATLQAQDLFSGAKRESTSYGADFHNYSLSESDSPTFMLNLSYNFNNYKPDRKKERDRSDYGEDDF